GLDFFAGARIATDSLRKAGYSVDIHVFDTQNDSATVNRVLNNSAFASSDLIIGPLYSQAFVMVAEKARELGIPAVTPFSQSDALIEGYPNVIKVTPSSEQQMKEYAPALAQQFAVAKFILIQTDLSKDKSLCNQFKQAWAGINNAPELNEISFADFRTNQGILDAVKQNIVIFPSADEVKLIELSNRLYKLSDSYRIRLAGLNEWNSFDNVDFDILNKLQFVYASPLQQDFGSRQSLAFQKKYHEEFKGEPSYYAYQGFDVTCFFTKYIADYGSEGIVCLPSAETHCGLNACYKFIRKSDSDGYENISIRLTELRDFKPQPIK
ncbi:MAG: amino acid ABC transporter substrate-binding protein, partial [Bacteroidetes bacterium]|nr:amino acid ABC transporter substrate-binding protein [Bacteroidota bacterium]